MSDQLDCRWAIEALRSGVPNRYSVRTLGSTQPEAEREFRERLDGNDDGGLLISGGFGAGKSHLLEHFAACALGKNYVCSRIAVSKETPIYDLAKMFRAAVDSGELPGGNIGAMMDEIGIKLRQQRHTRRYADLCQWSRSDESGLQQIFPATLELHERSTDQDLLNRIMWFWSGDHAAVKVRLFRSGLRDIGAQTEIERPLVRDLPPKWLRFGLEIIKAAGYRGWAVLIDELELIGSYGSALQRARSYEELGRWMGATDAVYPGLVVAAATTEDLVAILEKRGDRERLPSLLQLRHGWGERRINLVKLGMDWLSEHQMSLTEMTDEGVAAALDRIRDIYGRAYSDWDAPDAVPVEAGVQRRMRYQVRKAITIWDLQRLGLLNEGDAPEIVVEPVKPIEVDYGDTDGE